MKLMATGATAAKDPPDVASSNITARGSRRSAEPAAAQPTHPATAAADMSIHFAK